MVRSVLSRSKEDDATPQRLAISSEQPSDAFADTVMETPFRLISRSLSRPIDHTRQRSALRIDGPGRRLAGLSAPDGGLPARLTRNLSIDGSLDGGVAADIGSVPTVQRRPFAMAVEAQEVAALAGEIELKATPIVGAVASTVAPLGGGLLEPVALDCVVPASLMVRRINARFKRA